MGDYSEYFKKAGIRSPAGGYYGFPGGPAGSPDRFRGAFQGASSPLVVELDGKAASLAIDVGKKSVVRD